MQFIKYTLTIALCFFSLLGISQNNVGIGAINPLMPLHVADSSSSVLLLENTQALDSNVNTSLYFKTGNGGYPYTGGIKTIGTGLQNGFPTARLGLFTFTNSSPNQLIERMSITDEGNIGIGLLNPLEKVHILGNLRVDNGGISSWGALTFHPDVDLSGDDVIQFLNSDGNETVRIHNNGNVGIGNDNPAEKLHISGNIHVDGSIHSSGPLTFHPDVDLSGDDVIQFLNSDGNETVRIHNNGMVGIGTPNPTANLQVGTITESKVIISPIGYSYNAELILGEGLGDFGIKMLYDGGEDKFKLLEQVNSTTVTPKTFMVIDRTNGHMGIGKDDPQTDLELKIDLNTTSANSGIQLNASERRWRMTVGGNQSPNSAYYQLLYRNHNQSSYTPHMTVTHTGDFGFGTTDIPAGYKMALTGKMIAEGVRVQVESAWPDYVFEEDYSKPTLHQLKKFLSENKHLPGFYSAQKMEKEGMDIEEITVQQQEWIEVNTLYILEQNEKIKELEKMVQSQAEQIILLIGKTKDNDKS